VLLIVCHLHAFTAVALEAQRATLSLSRLPDLRGSWGSVVVILEMKAETVAVSEARGTEGAKDRKNRAVDCLFVASESVRSGEGLETGGALEPVLISAHYRVQEIL